jgi:hypothetical protein
MAEACPRGCLYSDAWKCAVEQQLHDRIACGCSCHQYLHGVEHVDAGGNLEYPEQPWCGWDTDAGEPCQQLATASVVVAGVAFDVCERHRRQLVERDGIADR